LRAGISQVQNVEMPDADFKKISSLVYDLCGIHLNDGKRDWSRPDWGKEFSAATSRFVMLSRLSTRKKNENNRWNGRHAGH
jgi:hypothetical protein